MPSSTVENYLKAIFSLSDGLSEDELVSIGGIAKELDLTPGTITTMVKHLEKKGFINYVPRKGVMLTEKGRESALQVLRRHRLIELFLVEVMKLDWAHVHEEAEVLEHALSDRMVARIDEMLGRPSHDPHGDPIPNAQGVISEDHSKPLSECRSGDYELMRITRDDPRFLEWLQESGLRPGIKLSLVSQDEIAGIMEIRIHGSRNPTKISEPVASCLRVQACS